MILTDRKKAAVGAAPFSLAYETFEDKLVDSDRWMIVGYGLGDEPLNHVLGRAYRRKQREQRCKALRVLVIDFKKDGKKLQEEVARLVGVGSTQVEVDVNGIPDAIESGAWRSWCE